MSDFRLWSDFRLSTLDRTEKERLTSDFGVGRSWFLLGFWWILGRFWAVFRLSGHPLRISAVFGHPLRGFILPFLRLFLLRWVLIPPTTKAAYRVAKQPPQEDTKTAPEEYPGAIAKEKPPTVRPSTAFIFTLSFSGSRTGSRAAKPTHTKQPIFYTSLKARYAVRVGFPPFYRRIAESK